MCGKKLLDVEVVHRIYSGYNFDWEKAMLREVNKKPRKQLRGINLSVKLEFFLAKEHYECVCDLDNIIKTVIESLSSNEGHKPRANEYLMYDDSWIDNIEATKIPTEESDFGKEKTHIEICEWVHERSP